MRTTACGGRGECGRRGAKAGGREGRARRRRESETRSDRASRLCPALEVGRELRDGQRRRVSRGLARRGRRGAGEKRRTHSRPSYRPSPLVAHVDWMYHCLCLSEWRPSLSVISAAFMALGRSCLLAKTRRSASRSSSSLSMRCSSSRASDTRSRSFESTTKMMPCVFWKSAGGEGERDGVSDGLLEEGDAKRSGRRTMPPEGTDLVLPTDVPHGERDVLVLDRLDVEACGREREGEVGQGQ